MFRLIRSKTARPRATRRRKVGRLDTDRLSMLAFGYLDGTLTEREAESFQEQARTNPEAARVLLQTIQHETALRNYFQQAINQSGPADQ